MREVGSYEAMRRDNWLPKVDAVFLFVCVMLLLLTAAAAGSGGRRRAREAVCRAHLSRWGAMFDRHTSGNDGYFNHGWEVGETDLWMNALRSYYGQEHRLLLCPEATEVRRSPQEPWSVHSAWFRMTDLPGGGEWPYAGSYSINSWTNRVTRDRGSRKADWFWKGTQDVDEPSRIPVFADSVWHDAWPRHTDAPAAVPVGGSWSAAVGEMNHFCIERHGPRVNCLFMDWSVRPIGLKRLWTLKWHRQFDTEGLWTRAGGVTPADWPGWMRDFKDF